MVRPAWLSLVVVWCALGALACSRGCTEGEPGSDLGSADASSVAPRFSLVGVVLDAVEAPVPHAEVFLWPSGLGDSRPREVVADAHGRFTVGELAAADVALFVQTPGLGAVHLDRVPVPGPELRIQVSERGRTLVGRVVGVGGKVPVPGVAVVLGGAGLRGVRELLTDERGGFSFSGLGEGEYVLRAADELLASAVVRTRIEGETSTTAVGSAIGAVGPGLVLHLAGAAPVTGRVVDPRGQAVAGIEVEIASVPDDGVPEKVRTDVVGFFSTRALYPGTYRARIVSGSRAAAWAGEREVDLVHTTTATVLTLRAARKARVTGMLIDEVGRPVAGALVMAERTGGLSHPRRASLLLVDRVPVLSGPLPLAAEVALQPVGSGAVGAHGPDGNLEGDSTRSGGDGRFVLDHLFPGRLALRIEHGDFVPFRRQDEIVDEGAALDVGTIQLDRGIILRGVVTGAERLRAGARIEVVREDSVDQTRFVVHADLLGRFELRAPAGDYRVRVAMRADSEARVSLRTGGPAVPLVLRVP